MRTPKLNVLSNGLRVLLAPCEAESVAFGIFVESGSRHEEPSVQGISHFIEHMLFKGTPTRSPLDITRAIEGRGGNFNACTGEEATNYHVHLPSEYLEEAVEIVSDMYLNASMPEAEFVREKQVVLEEIKMYADEPDSVAMENLQRNLFPKSRLGASIAGSERTLRPLTRSDLLRYVRTHYLPENTLAVVVGEFDEAKAMKIITKALGRKRKGDLKFLKTENALRGAVRPLQIVEKAELHQAQLALGYRTFGLNDKRKYAATLLDAILGRGMSSRLFQEVREKRGLSYDIGSRMQFFRDAGILSITAGLDRAKAQEALRTIDREIRKISTHKVPLAELNSAKEFMVGNFRLTLERMISKLFFYGQTVLSFGRVVLPQEQVEDLRKVTREDILAAAQDIFRDENRSVSWVWKAEK